MTARDEAPTGLLQQALPDRIRSIVFGETVDAALADDLAPMLQVNRAHVVMLAERGLMPAAAAAAILSALAEVDAGEAAVLRGRPAPRGLYMLLESWLADRVGPDLAGRLHSGRSRNDMAATMLCLRLRRPVADHLLALQRLVAAFLRRARRDGGVILPIHTHFQPAQPISFGHYAAAAALALGRDVEAVLSVLRGIGRSPLGAGAIAGTALPIDPDRTAALLGFTGGPENSIDAIASRDHVLRLLAALAVHGVLASRLAQDLQFWTTREAGFFGLPDGLVGASSMMPQKRNAYLLEHVKGRSAVAAGGFAQALTAMHATPFSNSIAVGTEAVRPLFPAIRAATEAATLLRAVVEAALPDRVRMARSMSDGRVAATAVADRLVAEDGLPFREAHRRVGAAIRAGTEPEGWPDPADIVRAAVQGGGPAPANTARTEAGARARLHLTLAEIRQRRRSWRAADARLAAAVAALCRGVPDRAS